MPAFFPVEKGPTLCVAFELAGLHPTRELNAVLYPHTKFVGTAVVLSVGGLKKKRKPEISAVVTGHGFASLGGGRQSLHHAVASLG